MSARARPVRCSSVNAEHIERWTARLKEAIARRDSFSRQLAATCVEIDEIRRFLAALRYPRGARVR